MTATVKAMPSFTADLRLKPQAKKILRHLKRGRTITPMEALVIYGISRLAPSIYELRNVGYEISTTDMKDQAGHKYARYRLTFH